MANQDMDRFRGVSNQTQKGRTIKHLAQPGIGHIADHLDKAAKMAVTGDCDVHTTFNDHPIEVTLEEAQRELSPEKLADRIRGLISTRDALLQKAEAAQAKMLAEYAFAKKIHGDKFPDTF